jgi:hypothetical protein
MGSNRIIITVLIAFSISAPLSFGETRDVPEMVWLTLDPGGRPGGMGRAFAGVADDVNSTYWNPGGLANLEKNEITVMHEPRGVEGLGGMYYDYAAFAHPTDKYGTFAFSLVFLDAGKSDRTDNDGRILGTIHSYFFAPWFSWGYPLLPSLSVGASYRVAYQHLSDDPGASDTAHLFDFGMLYKTPLNHLNLGVSFTNIGPSKKRVTSSNTEQKIPMPRMLRVGVSYKFLEDDLNDLLATFETSKLLMNLNEGLGTELDQAVYSGGMEYWYADIVAVRAGYYYDEYGEIKGINLGFGISYYGLSFDYARVHEGDLFRDNHRFTVGYKF